MSTAEDVARLHAIADYRILEQPDDHELGGLVRLAASICAVPTAVINVVDDAEKGRAWRQEVAKAGLLAKRAAGLSDVLRGPLALRIVFHRQRPKGHFRTGGILLSKAGKATPWPIGKPDSTKLLRAVEDALTSVLWEDDAQIVRQTVEKVWGIPARAEIEVESL